MTSSHPTTSRWPWFLIANLALLLFFVIAFGREYIGNMQVEREIARLQQEESALTEDKAKTLELMNHLSSRYYLEQEGRTKEGLAKPGETRIVLTEGSLTETTEGGNADVLIASNPMRWFYYFFDRDAYDRLLSL